MGAGDDASASMYDWFRAPAVTPERCAKLPAGSPLPAETAFCWRSDFVAEALIKAQSQGCSLPTIDLKRAQDVFEREPSFAYILATHSEVVSINGRRELWSQAFVQILQVLQKLKPAGVNDVRLTEERLATLLPGKDFPPLSGRRLPLHRRGEIYDDNFDAFGPLCVGDSVEILVGRLGSGGAPS